MGMDTIDAAVRVLLIANGEPPTQELWEALRAEAGLVCAVDGGADAALRLGERPSIVFGDWDSVSPSARAELASARWRQTADQASTDLDKTLGCLIRAGARRISATAVMGRRADHSIACLGQLLKYCRQAAITFHTDQDDLFALPGRWSQELQAGRRVSILPVLGRTRVRTEGLQYPLHGEWLEMGMRDGVSNQALGGPVSVKTEGAPALVCVGRCAGDGLVFAPEARE